MIEKIKSIKGVYHLIKKYQEVLINPEGIKKHRSIKNLMETINLYKEAHTAKIQVATAAVSFLKDTLGYSEKEIKAMVDIKEVVEIMNGLSKFDEIVNEKHFEINHEESD